jgi:hypothetical protein
MARYLDMMLMPDEHVIYVARLHSSIYRDGLFTLLIGALLGSFGDRAALSLSGEEVADIVHLPLMFIALMIVAIGALELFFTFLRQISTELVVTNHRIIVKYGFYGAQIYEALLGKVTSVDIEQTMLGRLEGYGTVIVMAPASKIPPVDHVAHPFRFHSYVMHTVQQAAGGEKHPAITEEKTRLLESGSKGN